MLKNEIEKKMVFKKNLKKTKVSMCKHFKTRDHGHEAKIDRIKGKPKNQQRTIINKKNS